MSSVKNESVTINKMDLGRKPSVWEVLSSEKYFKWVLLIPLLLVLLAFMIYPMIYSIFHSFYDADLAGRVAVGLKNYRTMLRDTNFWIPLGRTAAVTVICIVSELLIGLGIATLWNRNFKGENIIRGLILLPLLVAPLILSIVWNFLLEYDIGFINQFLATIGLARVKWWDLRLALFTLCVNTVWQGSFSASIFWPR